MKTFNYSIFDVNGNFIKNDMISAEASYTISAALGLVHAQNEVLNGYTIAFSLLGTFLVQKDGWSRIVKI